MNNPGNRKSKACKIKNTCLCTSRVQAFIREKRVKRERVVAQDILEFLVQEGLANHNLDDQKSNAAGLRATQRFLKENGYGRGRKKGAQNYRLKEDILLKRDTYISLMIEANDKNTRQVVYMDESYINKNYACHEDYLYDPNDEQDLTTIATHKGQCYCFIAVILDANHSIPEAQRTDAKKACLMNETLDIFVGGEKQTKDYHGMFNHNYFVSWMQKLLEKH